MGFIGRHVVNNLRDKGHEVTIFDRHSNSKIWRDDVNFYLGDIKDKEAVSDAVGKHDGAINLAGILGTSEMVSTPIESVDVNIGGAVNFYEACKRFDKKGVQITVGNIAWFNSYAITKYCAERFGVMYNQESGTKIAIVRGLNVYGEHQKHAPIRKAVPNFIIQALRGEDITVFGDGMQLLDLIYAGDTAEILVRALEVDHGCYNQVMDAGSGDLFTCKHLVEKIIELSGSSSKIAYEPMRSGEPVRSITKGDPTTLRPLGYIPNTPLEEGLKKTIDWYKENYDWRKH